MDNEKKFTEAQNKEYQEYIKKFTPKTNFIKNQSLAFTFGGSLCTLAYVFQKWVQGFGIDEKVAGNITVLSLIFSAQLLTGLGLFHNIAKHVGAGITVPITGFANSMVATAMEFKNEGPVLGAGSKMFALAGPVLVYGISTSVIIGIIYYIFQL